MVLDGQDIMIDDGLSRGRGCYVFMYARQSICNINFVDISRFNSCIKSFDIVCNLMCFGTVVCIIY